jgi:predicted RNA-binding protein YlxR (DUF448 family)
MRPKRELLRVVRTPTGEVRVDPTGKASGRGAYVCPTPDCIEKAIGDRCLEHALEVPLPADAAGDLHALAGSRVQTPGRTQGGR